jgi:hypothetical protein
VCTLRCVFRWKWQVNLFLHTSHEKGCSPVCTLIWASRLNWLVKLSLRTLHEKARSWHPNRRNGLLLSLNDFTHFSQRHIFSMLLIHVFPSRLLLQENDFLEILQESRFSSLFTSGNAALFSPRSSSALISSMQCVAAVLVAFIATFWKEKKHYQNLYYKRSVRYFTILQLSLWHVLLDKKEARILACASLLQWESDIECPPACLPPIYGFTVLYCWA